MTRRRTLAGAFEPRRNALAFLRLLFAVLVVWHHSFPIGGYDGGLDPLHRWTGGRVSVGGLAVCGFFAVSGFLVTRSWNARTGPDLGRLGRYAWHRALRILPGFWVFLVVTAVVIAPVGWMIDGRDNGWPTFSWLGSGLFVITNAALPIQQSTIPGVLTSVGFRGDDGAVLPGSAWTLIYEAACYLLVAAFGLLGLLRRSVRWVPVAVLFVVCLATIYLREQDGRVVLDAVKIVVSADTLQFLVAFLTGVGLCLWADRVPASRPVGVVMLVLTVASVVWWGLGAMGAPRSPFTVIWLSTVLPIPDADRFGDFSYGIFLFAFPVQQLFAATGVVAWGPGVFTLVSLAATLPFAAMSWHLVERQALRLKSIGSS